MQRVVPIALVVAIATLLVEWRVPAAHAVDKAVFACEDTNAQKSSKLTADVVKCVAKCAKNKYIKQDPAAVCNTIGQNLDPTTQACVDKGISKYKQQIVKKCPGQLPNCGDYAPFSPGDATGFADFQADFATDLVLQLAEPAGFCAPIDNPADPAQKATFKCEETSGKEGLKYASAVTKCIGKCTKRRDQLGETGIDCDLTSAQLDAATATCIGSARQKAVPKINTACLDKAGGFPDCGVFDGAVDGNAVIDFIDAQLQVNNPLDSYCAP
jgi:hypothetical protein